MKSRGWGQDFARLEQFYMQRLINVTQDVTKGDMRYLVWQEVIDNNVVLPTDTVIHVWKDGNKFHDELARVIFDNVLPLTHGYLFI
jgi:hexosaminidase